MKKPKKVSEPYWRFQKRRVSKGRLSWYADPANEQFWSEVWQSRFDENYLIEADQGNLQDLENVLTSYLTQGGIHLEAGCGLGYWVAALKARSYDIEGIEYSEDLVRLLNKHRPDLPICHADALKLDKPDGYYDSYISFGVVEHRQEGPGPFLTEAYRVLKPDAIMIISVPYFSPLRQWKKRLGLFRQDVKKLDFFQYAFREREFASLLKAHGFRIEQVVYQGVQRGLVEELPFYFTLNRLRGAKAWKKIMLKLFKPYKAAHMILFVARKK